MLWREIIAELRGEKPQKKKKKQKKAMRLCCKGLFPVY